MGTLLIYGMGYHVLPRFAGHPLRWPRLAELQSWFAIGGVALVSMGWPGWYAVWPGAHVRLVGGGALQFLAAWLFTLLTGDVIWGRGGS